MSEKLKSLWYRFGGWFLFGLILAVIVIIITIGQAHRTYTNTSRTEAPPPAESEVTFNLDTNKAYTAEDGVVVIPAAEKSAERPSDPAQVWENAAAFSTENYTLPEDATLPDGSMGILTIPKLSLSAPIYETEEGGEMESMTKGIAHFAVSSAWDGNVSLCSHNVAPAGAVAYFLDIHQLKEGDTLSYKTVLGERTYKVTTIKEIAENDWSALARTEDNRLTLITCITGKPAMRLLVQAVEG